MRVSTLALSSVLLAASASTTFVSAFVPPTTTVCPPSSLPSTCTHPSMTATTTTTTALQATLAPFILGPMIRKMRDENAKKKMPMADAEEAAAEAPGLRVGSNAWKWPPVWPYDEVTFTPKDDIPPDPKDRNLAAMAGLSELIAAPGDESTAAAAAALQQDATVKLNPIEYWSKDVATTTTELSEGAAEKLKNHYSFYLEDGMSVLEFGAAENSYLPDGLKLGRHVGVGLSEELMKQNPALDESHVVDLNDVEEEKGVNSEILKQLATDSNGGFDAIIMANTIDFLTNPREVFKTAWYLLKPGGIMMVPFSNKDAYTAKFGRAQTKMWKDFNDDQHMWVCGSLFQFSAGDGWENLRGFDISPEGAKSIEDQNNPLGFLKGGQNTNLYVVQANRAAQDEAIDADDPEKSFRSKMWMLPVMESRDKILVAPRLRRTWEQLDDAGFLVGQVEYLPAVYESLIKMDQFSFTFNMQAQLAVNLISDPSFNANDDQIVALKQGLGLRTPSEDFWAPIGRLTSALDAEDKINLLAHLVPRFGSQDPAQEEALSTFVAGLEPTYDCIRGACPSLSEADVQLLGTELLASEILKPGRSTREEFARWLGALAEPELAEILASRKAVKDTAKAEWQDYRSARAEEARLEEERQKLMKQQLERARKDRTMEFDPRSGTFQEVKKK